MNQRGKTIFPARVKGQHDAGASCYYIRVVAARHGAGVQYCTHYSRGGREVYEQRSRGLRTLYRINVYPKRNRVREFPGVGLAKYWTDGIMFYLMNKSKIIMKYAITNKSKLIGKLGVHESGYRVRYISKEQAKLWE